LSAEISLKKMLPLRIDKIVDVAEGIRSFELVPQIGVELPAFTPGAHVSVTVPAGELRKYSLCNDPADRSRYVITVKREADGRGGSISLVDQAKIGDILPTSSPSNVFALAEKAPSYIFIAGGIGITPILSMIRSFGELPPAPWKLYYLSRTPETCAFREELSASELRGKVIIHHSYGEPEKSFDLWPVLQRPTSAHIYCCGPKKLMEAVRDMSGHWPHANVHFESFNAGGGVQPDDIPFTVQLAKSGGEYDIPVGRSILEVLREHGCNIPSSCESGTCGSCKTAFISGDVDHRDMVLEPEEMENKIMVCVSRARSSKLLLDI
jgi:phthalate 4,5-dioxygenase reductase subunit